MKSCFRAILRILERESANDELLRWIELSKRLEVKWRLNLVTSSASSSTHLLTEMGS